MGLIKYGFIKWSLLNGGLLSRVYKVGFIKWSLLKEVYQVSLKCKFSEQETFI